MRCTSPKITESGSIRYGIAWLQFNIFYPADEGGWGAILTIIFFSIGKSKIQTDQFSP